MRKEIHYIWIDWYSSTGSSKSTLIGNGRMALSEAKRMIAGMSAKALYRERPKWLNDCIKITISAQNITSGKVLYRRIINIKIKQYECI